MGLSPQQIAQLVTGGVGLGSTIASGANALITAKTQKKEANRLSGLSKNVQARDLQPEYYKALAETKLRALSGMPTYEAQKEALDTDAANALRSIKESSAYGGGVADAINAQLTMQNKNRMALDGQQSAYRDKNEMAAIDAEQEIGGLKEGMQKEKLLRQQQLVAAANAMLQSSTANRAVGINTIGSGATQAAGTIAQALGGGGETGGQTNTSPNLGTISTPNTNMDMLGALAKSAVNPVKAMDDMEFGASMDKQYSNEFMKSAQTPQDQEAYAKKLKALGWSDNMIDAQIATQMFKKQQ